jgi:acyl carrier protein
MESVQTAVFELIASTAGVNAQTIQPSMNIRDLGIASLDAIEMLFAIEEKFNIELADRDVDLQNASAATLVAAVEGALKSRDLKSTVTAPQVR